MSTYLDPEIIIPPMRIGEPAWVVASFFPVQGKWSEEDYFRLEAGHRIELVNGCIEALPMPTAFHQRIIAFLYKLLAQWNEVNKLGEVYFASLPLKLFPGTIREPDILIARADLAEPYPDDAYFVIEVVSEGEEARSRDHQHKRADYAKAGIPEYWIVDPFEKTVTVLKLVENEYVLHGRFTPTEIATAATLQGFSVACCEIWALERKPKTQ
jgi:Uma2 family endonuclease